MIFCHCAVVGDREVAAAIDAGARTVAQVCRATGAGQQCGDVRLLRATRGVPAWLAHPLPHWR